jgi:ubiquinone/menaquinone biosynthesis C-methylase UbiE
VPREIPERYRWAVDLLDVRPDDRMLEIGCGRGHMIGLICERLTSGHITAIDRSSKMAEAAKQTNKRHVTSGKATVLHQDLLDSLLPSGAFDKVFLFNINAFWMDPVSELAEVRRSLKQNGEVFIFHQPPPDHDIDEFVDAFGSNLEKNGFEIISRKVSRVEGKDLACVMSRPSPR